MIDEPLHYCFRPAMLPSWTPVYPCGGCGALCFAPWLFGAPFFRGPRRRP